VEQFLTIEIFGQPYTLKTASEGSKGKEIADFLVREVSEIEARYSGKSTTVDRTSILLLAALNIAHKNFELRKGYSDTLKEISERFELLSVKLDNALPAA
jgi:cell division protein ZapA (FtsZ GTPase activity inhibitor)